MNVSLYLLSINSLMLFTSDNYIETHPFVLTGPQIVSRNFSSLPILIKTALLLEFRILYAIARIVRLIMFNLFRFCMF